MIKNKTIRWSYKYIWVILVGLVFGGFVSDNVLADDNVVIDKVNVAVPMSCTLSGTGMTSHTARIPNGIYEDDIGTTTLKVFCNDNNGFAIYAAGYTGNTIGGENSNKLVGDISNIVTGLATSAGNPDVSNWAMKLQTNANATYSITIDSDTGGAFSNYHTVPNQYVKVAHRDAVTDMGPTAEGASLTTTYATYAAKEQAAGTYQGQVIYTLVHPSNADEPVHPDQIGINYNGNGLTFPGGATKNRVVYGNSCTAMYMGTTPTISKTTNLNNDGTQNGPISNGDDYGDTVTIPGADKLKVILTYDIDPEDITYGESTGGVYITNDSSWSTSQEYIGAGTKTVIISGDTVYFWISIWNDVDEGHDYGYYAKVYPIYTTEQANTEAISICGLAAQSGAYATTTTWKGKWYTVVNEEVIEFADEAAVISYLENNSELLGTTIELYAYNHPYTIVYNGNGATAGTMDGFYTTVDYDVANSTADLMAYNFKKAGYGFAGWSEDQNATVNSSSKIYGPNEKVTGADLNFDANTHQATLYAVWVPAAGTMQSFSCSSLSDGQITALTDSRDNNVYTVGKMQDGACWMMENLRLDAANSSDSSKAQGFGGVFTGLANSEDANFSNNSTTANSKYSTSNITGSYQSYRFPRYNNNNTNIGGANSNNVTLTASPGVWDPTHWDDDQYNEGNNDHSQWYGYGNYYTWAAAMANTTSLTSVSASEAVSTSICPTGFSLPYGNSTGNGASKGSFSYLDIQLGGTGTYQSDEGEEVVSNRWRSYPNNFVYSGYWGRSSAYGRGNSGRYWSRTAYSSDYAYYLYMYYDTVSPGKDYYERNYGHVVRCINLEAL